MALVLNQLKDEGVVVLLVPADDVKEIGTKRATFLETVKEAGTAQGLTWTEEEMWMASAPEIDVLQMGVVWMRVNRPDGSTPVTPKN